MSSLAANDTSRPAVCRSLPPTQTNRPARKRLYLRGSPAARKRESITPRRRWRLRSAVPLRLQVEQRRVAAALGDQLGVRAALDHLTVVEHDDLIGHAHGREPV